MDNIAKSLDNLLGNLYKEFELCNQENAIKLKKILDLEKILYITRLLDNTDGSPCWCAITDNDNPYHAKFCEDARNATKPLWSK